MKRFGRSTSQASCLASAIGRGGVVGQARVDLDGDPAVLAAGGVVDRAQDVGGVADVRGGDHPHGLLDGHLAGGEVVQLLVVAVAAR